MAEITALQVATIAALMLLIGFFVGRLYSVEEILTANRKHLAQLTAMRAIIDDLIHRLRRYEE